MWHCDHSTWTTDKMPIVDLIRFGAWLLPNCGFHHFSTGNKQQNILKVHLEPRLLLMAWQLPAVKWGIEKVAGSHSVIPWRFRQEPQQAKIKWFHTGLYMSIFHFTDPVTLLLHLCLIILPAWEFLPSWCSPLIHPFNLCFSLDKNTLK